MVRHIAFFAYSTLVAPGGGKGTASAHLFDLSLVDRREYLYPESHFFTSFWRNAHRS
jgi:hypothetical protein